METCKDCLHINVCKQWYPPLPDKYHDGCEHFIDKAEHKPVIHSQWKIIGMRPVGTKNTHYYSLCGYHGMDEMRFCPGCGAKMIDED